VEGHEDGALVPTGRGQLMWRGNDRQRRACTHNGGRHRVIDEWDRLAAKGHGGERHGARMGRLRKEMKWAEPGENAKWSGPRCTVMISNYSNRFQTSSNGFE
jgi:hypothetical protein